MELNTHIKRVHKKVNTVICDQCGKFFVNRYSLRKHTEIEHSEIPKATPVPEQCKLCGTWLSHSEGLKAHIKNVHESDKSDTKCNICGWVSTTTRALKRHIYNKHNTEKKYQCTMCEKAFKHSQNLKVCI